MGSYFNNTAVASLCEIAFNCEWCGYELKSNIEEVNTSYLKNQEMSQERKKEVCKCEKCGNRTAMEYEPSYFDLHHGIKLITWKMQKSGRRSN